MSLYFGDFALDQERRQLLRGEMPVPLEAKAYELLSLLVARRPRVLSKSQIREVLWPGTVVGETSLPRLVTELRQALGDDAQRPRFIRTAHAFGYAFCGETHEDGQAGAGRPGAIGAWSSSHARSDGRPYPGLFAFTEAESDQFFGREAEVAALWEKVRRQKLLALIGPSGAGKSSLVRAGVIAHRPEGWITAYMTPGAIPAAALARALTPGSPGDGDAVADMVHGVAELLQIGKADRLLKAAARWKQPAAEGLLVIDQFEELFTQNPRETQESFATFLGRLADETGIHVLLSLRDDYLFRCHSHSALHPVFDHVTPLGPPSSEALRRALVEPAARHGVRFEDETLVDEMVGAVAKGRGALPLLAFAASRLWEERDRERKVLTRDAYERIGGVEGALAEHAERTLGEIGPLREGIVREAFRNLTTAGATRAAREREELLSVFEERGAQPGGRAAFDRGEAEDVLDVLVAARLLTEYDDPEDRGRPRIEIVHESLLTHWPRLERWRAQDEGGALLRDQLRQAARLWDEKKQPKELLWTGPAYREFVVWREHYTGGLSRTEMAFAEGMEAQAARRRWRRRLALAVALTIAAVTSSLWQRSEVSRRRAEGEALRAEAAKLLALGQVELDRDPTDALVYAVKSLELADTGEARLFALRALQRGPVALLTPILPLDNGAVTAPAFSPDGEWLALGGWKAVDVFRRDGTGPRRFGHDYVDGLAGVSVGFGARSDRLVANRQGDTRVFSVPDGRVIRRDSFGGPSALWTSGEFFLTATKTGEQWILRRTPMGDGQSHLLGHLEPEGEFDIVGTSLAFARGRSIYLRALEHWAAPPKLLAENEAEILELTASPDGQRLLARDKSGEIWIWSTARRTVRPLRVVKGQDTQGLRFDASGARLAGFTNEGGRSQIRLWDLRAPASAEPLTLRRYDYNAIYGNGLTFDPSGRWLAAARANDVALWRVDGDYPHVIAGHVVSLGFTPDGNNVVYAGQDGTVRIWPLPTADDQQTRLLLRTDLFYPHVALDPTSRNVVLGAGRGRLLVVPLTGAPAREFARLYSADSGGNLIALDAAGTHVASIPFDGPLEDRLVKVVDLDTGAVTTLPRVPGTLQRIDDHLEWLQFLGPDQLLVSESGRGLLLYDLRKGTGRIVAPFPRGQFTVGRDGRAGVGITGNPEEVPTSELIRFSLDGAPAETLTSHGTHVRAVALDLTGTLVATGSVDGTVRIGPVSGGEPHLFFGHDGQVMSVAFSPDGHWVASGGNDRTVRLWRVPDTSKPPPHKLERERFLAMLRGQTNLRVVKDPKSPSGWRVDRGAFPGWADLPEW